ncbi:unnamed protein product, partial [Polarella glacialis]
FIKIVDFDLIARTLPPAQLLGFLNDVFTRLDKMRAARNVTKIETVGEEYICAVGVGPADRLEDEENGHGDILMRLLRMANDILALHSQGRCSSAVFQMGLHTGPVVAGVVGQKLPRFRLFGDTMNTAARMMQKGIPN